MPFVCAASLHPSRKLETKARYSAVRVSGSSGSGGAFVVAGKFFPAAVKIAFG